MSDCLPATFTLTPRSPLYQAPTPQNYPDTQESYIACYGTDVMVLPPYDFSSLYGADSLYFNSYTHADPTGDYKDWTNVMRVPHIAFYVDLRSFGTAKSLMLVFGFSCPNPARVLVYTYAGKIADQTLDPSDNQFLLEIESLASPLMLNFIHAGGEWVFKGLSGYVV
jgi:hypothetical protein